MESHNEKRQTETTKKMKNQLKTVTKKLGAVFGKVKQQGEDKETLLEKEVTETCVQSSFIYNRNPYKLL